MSRTPERYRVRCEKDLNPVGMYWYLGREQGQCQSFRAREVKFEVSVSMAGYSSRSYGLISYLVV